MPTLHIAPMPAAGTALRTAVGGGGRESDVLIFPDNLSYGPIAPDSDRARWWAELAPTSSRRLPDAQRFWDRIAQSEARLVVWFGRGSAAELSFLLAWTDRIDDRTYHILDVTGRRFPRRHAAPGTGEPAAAASMLTAEEMKSLIGTEREMKSLEKLACRGTWRQLAEQNASLRLVTPTGMVSASPDHFDATLLAHVGTDWTRMTMVIAHTMSADWPRMQVDGFLLHTRIVALVESGALLADGNPWDMQGTNLRLP